jgi:hypothetical protein
VAGVAAAVVVAAAAAAVEAVFEVAVGDVADVPPGHVVIEAGA